MDSKKYIGYIALHIADILGIIHEGAPCCRL
jgi:hypothetical protein